MRKQPLAERHLIAHLNMLATYHEAQAVTNVKIAETYKALVAQAELLLGARVPASPVTPPPPVNQEPATPTYSMNGTIISAVRGILAKHQSPLDLDEIHRLLGGPTVLSRATLSGTLSRGTGTHWERSGLRGSYRYSPML